MVARRSRFFGKFGDRPYAIACVWTLLRLSSSSDHFVQDSWQDAVGIVMFGWRRNPRRHVGQIIFGCGDCHRFFISMILSVICKLIVIGNFLCSIFVHNIILLTTRRECKLMVGLMFGRMLGAGKSGTLLTNFEFFCYSFCILFSALLLLFLSTYFYSILYVTVFLLNLGRISIIYLWSFPWMLLATYSPLSFINIGLFIVCPWAFWFTQDTSPVVIGLWWFTVKRGGIIYVSGLRTKFQGRE